MNDEKVVVLEEQNINIEDADNLEIDDIKVQMMRYQANKLSYGIGFLALISTLFYLFPILNAADKFLNNQSDIAFLIAVKILANIFIFLMTFLSVEKMKAYSVSFSILMIVFGGLNIVRIFIFPLMFYTKDYITGGKFTYLVIVLIISAALYIFSGVVSYIKSTMLKKYLKRIGELK